MKKIVGSFILACTDPGREGLVDMGCKTIESAVRMAWQLDLVQWEISGMVDDEFEIICRSPEKR